MSVAKKEIAEKSNKAYESLKRELSQSVVNEASVKAIQDELDVLEELSAGLHALKRTAEVPDCKARKAFDAYLRTGETRLLEALVGVERKSLMRTDIGEDGGYLLPGNMQVELLRELTEVSDIRSVSRVNTMEGKALTLGVKTADTPTASFEGEAEAARDSTPKFGQRTITAHRQTVKIPVTQDALMNVGYNLEEALVIDVAEAFAQNEGTHHVTGDGNKKPGGFATNALIRANARESMTAETITGDDVVDMIEDIKEGYEGVFVLNRSTLRAIRRLKDDQGQFLFQLGANSDVRSIAGFPYLVAKDMDSVSAGKYPLAFGDFRRGYEVTDRVGTQVVRDIYSRKREGIIELVFHRWTTGQVVIPEAIALLKIKI